MAINVKRLVYRIRFKVKDMDEVTYSDYDVMEAVNECIRYLNQDKALKNSDFLEKVRHYVQEEMNAEVAAWNEAHPTEEPKPLYDFPQTGAELPEDLITMVDIIRLKDGYHMSPIPAVEQINPHTSGQFKVVNGRIYANTDFDLLYRAEIAQITLADMSDSEAIIELPEVFSDLLAKVAVMILTNTADNDVMAKEVSRVTDNLITGRRYNNIKVRMPFIV
jgi:hypothetical protein